MSYQVVPKRIKFLESVVLPTKPKSPYSLFMTDATARIKKANPDFKNIEVLNQACKEWTNLREGSKKKY